jgi:hypothetical protein
MIQSGLENILNKWKDIILYKIYSDNRLTSDITDMLSEINTNVKLTEKCVRCNTNKNSVKIIIVTTVGVFTAKNPNLPMEKLSTRPVTLGEVKIDNPSFNDKVSNILSNINDEDIAQMKAIQLRGPLSQMWEISDNFIVITKSGKPFLARSRYGNSNRFIDEEEFNEIVRKTHEITSIVPRKLLYNYTYGASIQKENKEGE